MQRNVPIMKGTFLNYVHSSQSDNFAQFCKKNFQCKNFEYQITIDTRRNETKEHLKLAWCESRCLLSCSTFPTKQNNHSWTQVQMR